ncbi:MAG: UDP-glucose/GDP-mannose dehydrogenase family protein [Planctomycetes bacterium]|nr:UDP-glucose/GDP-mannose dehydrogenase family protein [Planctomycetota bacterium]
MKIGVVGTGYVGLVTGTCFADSGNTVTCLDINADKIARLNKGEVPIYEPGLEELVERNVAAGRLKFTTDTAAAIKEAEVVFLAVGTPPSADGSADLSALWKVVDTIAPHLRPEAIVVTKSTVPVGTCAGIEKRLLDRTGRACRVASNPEFLKEGAAIEDFQKPDRVVVGVRSPDVGETLRSLYLPFLRTENPFLVMSPESSEMTKYVANALLATKISFINEVANLCERMEADIDDVRRGIGHDSRIGFAFLFPGVGYGGSCFPKDVQALAAMARDKGIVPRILTSVHDTNLAQKKVLGEKIAAHFGGNLKGRKVAVWGLAFKPRTDDTRDAPALDLIDRLLEGGAAVRVFDPEALANVKALYGDRLEYAAGVMDTLDGADCLAIVTEWGDFRRPDFDEVARRMKAKVIFDGRNLYAPSEMRARGFVYHSIGKVPVGQG